MPGSVACDGKPREGSGVTKKHPLGGLIQAVQQANGWSDRDLELRAGGLPGMGKSNLSKLKNQPIRSVRGSTIKNLARLLAVPERLVARATLASLEDPIDLEEEIDLREAIAAAPNLDASTKLLLSDLLGRISPAETSLVGDTHHRQQVMTRARTEVRRQSQYELDTEIIEDLG